MAPSTTSPKSAMVSNKTSFLGSRSRDATPIAAIPETSTPSKDDPELASIFRSDLTSIRALVTCSICDQLLYEPWTLGCGHTYCYSCLCSWFVPNKRKKTCPECRTKVKQMPAPSFLVKQMVEVFTKRTELMPPDESQEQHTKKRLEEIAEVEKDKNSPDGLFRGTFPDRVGELWLDEEDGILRCPGCGHEHEGGPECQHCGQEIDEDSYGFSEAEIDEDLDSDLDDLENLELDLDAEVDAEFAESSHPFMHTTPHFGQLGGSNRIHFHGHHFHPHHHHGATDLSSTSGSDGSQGHSDSEEDDGSLHEFVVPDDEEPGVPFDHPQNSMSNRQQHQPITISDDESDEGGAISSRRRVRGNEHTVLDTSSPIPTAFPATDASASGSEAGDINSEAEMLRHAGWSPLDHGEDSEAEDQYGASHYNRFPPSERELDSDDESDTDTMVGNGLSDGDDDNRSRDDHSETPTYDLSGYPVLNPYGDIPRRSYTSDDEEADDDDSDAGQSGIMDRDGDTEMSVTPSASGGSRSSSVNPWQGLEQGNTVGLEPNDRFDRWAGEQGRGISFSTDENRDPWTGYFPSTDRRENLGVANDIHGVEDDSSDSSDVRAPPRRRPRRYNQDARVQQYDPRISMIFAEHQESLRDSQNKHVGLEDDWEDEVRTLEPGSRARRTTSYRLATTRQMDPLRSTRSPSVTRVISSSQRGRAPRQYVSSYHN